jgi:hypothetical protein
MSTQTYSLIYTNDYRAGPSIRITKFSSDYQPNLGYEYGETIRNIAQIDVSNFYGVYLAEFDSDLFGDQASTKN